jgi:putative colanic acid biosynthesis glycosyltransferase
MKVLLIDVNCKYSSTGKIVYDLYTALNLNGHTAAICYGRGPLVEGKNIYKFSSNIEVKLHALLTRITGLTGYFSYFATRNLLKFIERFKPDVVHIHELHAYFVNIAPVINYLKENNIKTIWTFHCEFMYTGKCGYAFDCDNWRNKCGNCPQVKGYPSSFFFDFTKKMFKDKKKLFEGFINLQIVTPSQWLADRVKRSFLGNQKISVIHNGIDTQNVFFPRTFDHLKSKHQITEEKIILAAAPGIMEERKGGKYIIELAKRFRNQKFKFILIGVDNLNEKFDDNIVVLGRTKNQTELAEYYSMANVFVICSSRENFPTTCIEALSCGTPIVGFDTGGTKETAPGELGTFVSYGDLDGLQNAILETNKSKELSEKCETFGKMMYSNNRMYESYMSLYEQ